MRAPTLVATALLAGCASTSHKSASTPLPAPAALTENTAPTAAPSGDYSAAFEPPAGWRAKIVDWEVMYCRKGAIGGSRMTKELCLTEVQLKEHTAANDEMRRDLDRSRRICGRDGCTQ